VAKALLVVPVPCDARLFSRLVIAVTRAWQRQHPGHVLTMDHLETRATEFGSAVVIWDERVGVAGG
jgi:hypothetical protein